MGLIAVVYILLNDAKTFLKHFSNCLFYFCSTCADSITEYVSKHRMADEMSGRLTVTVQSVCFSDHHVLTCRLGMRLTPPITTTFSYRSLRRINRAAFCHDILRSKLFGSIIEDADEYSDLFDAEVKRVLDIHAPLRTGRRRCGQHDAICQMKPGKPSNCGGGLKVVTVGQAGLCLGLLGSP